MDRESGDTVTAADLERAAALLAGARHVVALTGAGLSVESGIPPFRGPCGLWTKHGEPPMNGYQRFLAGPARASRERLSPSGPMRELWETLRAAQPNAGHRALAALEDMGIVRYLITQNVDNLHTAAGSRAVAEIHGNYTLIRCLECVARFRFGAIALDELPPLPTVPRAPQERHRVVRRTHSARRAAALFRGHGVV